MLVISGHHKEELGLVFQLRVTCANKGMTGIDESIWGPPHMFPRICREFGTSSWLALYWCALLGQCGLSEGNTAFCNCWEYRFHLNLKQGNVLLRVGWRMLRSPTKHTAVSASIFRRDGLPLGKDHLYSYTQFIHSSLITSSKLLLD